MHDSFVSGTLTNVDVLFSVTNHRKIVRELYSEISCSVGEY